MRPEAENRAVAASSSRKYASISAQCFTRIRSRSARKEGFVSKADLRRSRSMAACRVWPIRRKSSGRAVQVIVAGNADLNVWATIQRSSGKSR